MLALIDQEIAHISRAMKLSMLSDLGGPILPGDYWRNRLHNLLDSYHLTKAQLCLVDSLLLQLDVKSGLRVARVGGAVAAANADHVQPLDDAESQLLALTSAISAASDEPDAAVGDTTRTAAAI
jgi:hypothetical protein